MLWVFDMDGTIVDSRNAVREAYKRAGVKMPDSAWGRPWRDWLPEAVGEERAMSVHADKCAAYWNTARELGRPLPALQLLRELGGQVITSASPDAVSAVREALGVPFSCGGTQFGLEDKVRHLEELGRRGERIVYVDDDSETGVAVMDAVPTASFLHVTEHDGVFHLHENPGRGPNGGRRVMRWTLSSWLPGATID